MVFHETSLVFHGSWLVVMVPGQFSWLLMVPGWFFMIFGGSRLVSHGSRSVFMVFHGSKSVFVISIISWFQVCFSLFLVGFSCFFPECTCLNCILASLGPEGGTRPSSI